MVKAKYRVYEQIQQMLQNKTKVSTQDIASAMKLSRGVISLYLSQLYKEGVLIKKGTKPVYWQISSDTDVFENMIGSNRSLKKVVDKCKSAVNYPPHGFPLIITGPSGSGKSYLASLIYQYAKQKGVITEQANFVVLNCADYANNPELLSSVLFGYKKGAFTGADSGRLGLVDQADGGYLFLDEIHRLPRESQEKLFALLDSGNFYPLGENEHFKHVNVRFIFATTENIENKLLRTFRRRVPLHVTLTSISERPLVEKCELIELFFKREARRIQQDIKVSYKVVKDLLNTDQIGNVGSLENQVKLLCADSFSLNTDTNLLEVGTENEKCDYWLIKKTEANFILHSAKLDLEKKLSTLISTLSKNEKSNHSIADQTLVMNQFLRDLQQTAGILMLEVDFADFLFNQLNLAIEKVSLKYGVSKYLQKDKIKQTATFLSIIQKQAELPDAAKIVESAKTHYPRTIYLCLQVKQALKIDIDDNWLIIALLYMTFDEIAFKVEQQNLLGIMVCHGGAVASNICSIVNQLCGNYIFEAFDMPIDVSNTEIVQQINQYIKEQNRKYDGTILLFDMGSLSSLYKDVKALLHSDLLVINNLTTAIALDLGLQIQQNTSFKKIAEKAENYPNTMKIQYYEGISQKSNIIVSCMSGVGLSEEVKKIMQRVLKSDIEIITMDYEDLRETLHGHDINYFKNTNLILTTNDIVEQKGICILNIYDIMDKDGSSRFHQLLREMGEADKTINILINELLKFFTIGGVKDRLRFLNPEVVLPEIQKIVEKLEQFYHLNLDNKFKLSLYMHIALMLERLMLDSNRLNNTKSGPKKEYATPKEKEFNLIAQNVFRSLETEYNIKIKDYEISLIYEIFRSNLKF